MIYIPKYFKIQEFLPEDFYNEYKMRTDNLWFIFDGGLLRSCDVIRERYGKIFINTWLFSGDKHLRGWRPFNSDVGKPLSQHKFGRAADLEPQIVSAEEIRRDIIARKNEIGLGAITCIEKDVSWLHIDTRNYNGLLIVAA